jgi:hypothetical protein
MCKVWLGIRAQAKAKIVEQCDNISDSSHIIKISFQNKISMTVCFNFPFFVNSTICNVQSKSMLNYILFCPKYSQTPGYYSLWAHIFLLTDTKHCLFPI